MGETTLMMARRLAEAAAQRGGRAYFVGGYVRDRLRAQSCERLRGQSCDQLRGQDCDHLCGQAGGEETADIDIEVHGLTPETLEEILDRLGTRLEIGKSFGVYTLAGYGLDVAMPRRETAIGRGHRDFQVDVDPFLGTEKAARRRDFTVNAMMEDVLTGEIIDHFGGQADLRAGILRHVDARTFGEDPLRVLRGAQFAARFAMQVAPETIDLARHMDLCALPPERVMGELQKALLQAAKPSIFFVTLAEMGQLEAWFGEVAALRGLKQSPRHHPEGDVWTHTMLTLDRAAELRDGMTPEPAGEQSPQCLKPADRLGFMLAALCHDFGKAVTTTVDAEGRIHAYGHEKDGLPLVRDFLDRLTANKRLKRYVLNLVELHMKPNLLAAQRAKPKTTNKLFDAALDPAGLVLLAKADALASGRKTGPKPEDERFLRERLRAYQALAQRPQVCGEDLIAAGLAPGPEFAEILAYAHKLHLAGIEKESALRQALAWGRSQRGKTR